MNSGCTIFAQLLELLPRRSFEWAVERYAGEKKLRRYSCMDQRLCVVFAQLTSRSSLHETVSCLRALGLRRYHCGIRSLPARSTLAEANERRDFRIFMDTALSMIASAQMERPVDADTGKRLTFLTNHLTLDALAIALLYRKRWKIELLFKWMKQHLRIKVFFGTTPNAVKTQMWIAVMVYVMIHRLKHRHELSQTPNEIAQILSVMHFEKIPINQAFSELQQKNAENENHNQLMLFDF